MAIFLPLIGQAVSATGRGLWKTATYSPFTRAAMGGVGGAVYGGATSEANTLEGTLRDAMMGGAVGGLAGFGLSRYGLRATKRVARGTMNVAKGVFSPFSISAKRAAKGSGKLLDVTGGKGWKNLGRVAGFVSAYPRTTAGVLGVGLAGAMLSGREPGPINPPSLGKTPVTPEGDLYRQSPTAYTSSVGFRESTAGLVQGLHAGRHRQ